MKFLWYTQRVLDDRYSKVDAFGVFTAYVYFIKYQRNGLIECTANAIRPVAKRLETFIKFGSKI